MFPAEESSLPLSKTKIGICTFSSILHPVCTLNTIQRPQTTELLFRFSIKFAEDVPWHGLIYDYSRPRVWGSRAYALNHVRGKDFGERSAPGIFVGMKPDNPIT